MGTTPTGEASLPSPFADGELYDVLLGGLDYGVDFYVGLAREARGPVLDIACGTGRVLLPCLQAGADGDGLDLWEPMLGTLRKKADALGLSPGLPGASRSGEMNEREIQKLRALGYIGM